IITAKNKQYIDIKRNSKKEYLIINKVIKQYLERKEEGELLYKVTNKYIVNIMRYYYYEIV
ncbi:hypothetical protein P154DRAFT_422213, partial [Amniculicola lignicola CBS 123094]